MKKSKKVLLGVATAWPLLWLPIFMLVMFSTLIFSAPGGRPDPDVFPLALLFVLPVHFITVFGSIALSIFYIVNVFRNKRVPKDQQVLWVVLLIMFGIVAEPIYWYLYIWKDEALATGAEPKALNNADGANWADYASQPRREHEYAPPKPPPTHGWRD